jgi:hypothetical protein
MLPSDITTPVRTVGPSRNASAQVDLTADFAISHVTARRWRHMINLSPNGFGPMKALIAVEYEGTWNVFPLWSKECPWVLELAEVSSLGRSMWMLLRQPVSDFEGIEHPDQLVTDWDKSDDIPITWKQIVDRCVSEDPNVRPDLSELVGFWTKEWSAQKAANGIGQ